jgi:DeoR family fructose operon transcriptional repressor
MFIFISDFHFAVLPVQCCAKCSLRNAVFKSESSRAQRSVSASDLVKAEVTAATIRRDLAALEQEECWPARMVARCQRMSSTNFQPTYDALLRSESEEKRQIARVAEQFVLDGDTIFLESSTTVFELARRLSNRNRLTVVTNSPPIVCELQRSPGVTVMCTGGDLHKDTFYLSGEWAQRALSEMRLDKAILGVSAIDPQYGVSTVHHAEAQVTRMVSKAAKTRIALADHTKFGRQRFAYVGPVTDIDILVTDSGTDPKYVQELRDSGLQVIIADSASSRTNGQH